MGHEQLLILYGIYSDACHAYVKRELNDTFAGALAADELSIIAGLEWVGLFDLALVWIGRRLDEKGMGKTWVEAKTLLGDVGIATDSISSVVAGGGNALAAAETMLAHYTMLSGQHLA